MNEARYGENKIAVILVTGSNVTVCSKADFPPLKAKRFFRTEKLFRSHGISITLTHKQTHICPISLTCMVTYHTNTVKKTLQCSPGEICSVLHLTHSHRQIYGTLASETGSVQKKVNGPLNIPDHPKTS